VIRVGFLLETDTWMGGINYYRNLFSALSLLPVKKVQPVVFVGTQVSSEILRNFRHAEVVSTKLLDSKSLSGRLRRILTRVGLGRDLLLQRLLTQYRIDVLSHAGGFREGDRIKTIGWITDFQHVHLPQFFNEQERARRDADFHQIVNCCDRILLSSEAAKRDLAKFDARGVLKARVLQFVPEVDTGLELASITELENKYGFHSPYFYVPNQFWIHKNHRVVIEALGHLKALGKPVTVLSSGSTKDYRHPDHFHALMRDVKRLGVEEFFRPLGLIPYADLISLMQHSLSVINPSLFEGWSSTVEEAKALDKTILLSNLPVHIEQNPSRGLFFDPMDAEELAGKMLNVYEKFVGQETRNFLICSKDYESSRIAFAQTYQDMVDELCRS